MRKDGDIISFKNRNIHINFNCFTIVSEFLGSLRIPLLIKGLKQDLIPSDLLFLGMDLHKFLKTV